MSRVMRGMRFTVLDDLPVTVMTQWAGPGTGSHERVLAAGETFTIEGDPAPGAKAVYCLPDRYAALHSLMVPLADRARFWAYRGYVLCVDAGEIASKCEASL